MHYEKHIHSIFSPIDKPIGGSAGRKCPNLRKLGEATDNILQSINMRKGKIVSVTPIIEGSFNYDHDYGYSVDDKAYGFGYGWGMSSTRALLFIVEYPD